MIDDNPGTFAKLLHRVTGSSLLDEPLIVRYVFVFSLPLAWPNGNLNYTRIALARALNVSLDDIEAAAACLLSPDSRSRSKAEGGRRWLPLNPENQDGGWHVVNFKENHKDDFKRLKWQEAQQRSRARRAALNVDTVDSHVDSHLEESRLEEIRRETPKNGGEPPVIDLPTNRNDIAVPISQAEVDEWRRLYPGVEILSQLRAMRGWLLANPTKRKTAGGMKRFVNSWLAREQNRAPVFAPPEPQEPVSRATALTRIERDAQDALRDPEGNREAARRAREQINRLVAGIGKGET